jgi:hypothetical protein
MKEQEVNSDMSQSKTLEEFKRGNEQKRPLSTARYSVARGGVVWVLQVTTSLLISPLHKDWHIIGA